MGRLTLVRNIGGISFVILMSLFFSSSTLVFADEGGAVVGDGTTGTGASTTCHTNNCYSRKYGAVWFKYKFRHKKKDGSWSKDINAKTELKLPLISVVNGYKKISNKCAQADAVYFLGYAGHQRNGMASGYQLGPVTMGKTKLMGGDVVNLNPGSAVKGTKKAAFQGIELHGTVSNSYDDYIFVKNNEKNEKYAKDGLNIKWSVVSWGQAKQAFGEMQTKYASKLPKKYRTATWGSNGMKSLVYFCYWGGEEPKKGEIKSRSKVLKPQDSDWSEPDGGGKQSPTKGKATVTYKLQDSDAATQTVKVTFKHLLRISTTGYKNLKKANPSTKWVVTQTTSGQSGNVKRGSGTTYISDLEEGSTGKTYNKTVFTDKVDVTVRKNKKTTVCQVINYENKKFTEEGGKITDKSGKNDSEACITLTYGTPPELSWCDKSFTDATSNYGNTFAKTEVRKYTHGGDWTTGTILAMPSEEIRFRHCLGFGDQAVTSSGYSDSSTRRPSTAFSYFPANWFYLTAERSNAYLFDRQYLTSTKTIPKAQKRPNLSGRSGSTGVSPDSQNDWVIRIYSPSSADAGIGAATSYAANKYNCNILSWVGLGSHKTAYQIPDFSLAATNPSSVNCNSKDNISVDGSDVGHTLSQTIHFNNIKARVQYKHNQTNASCSCNNSSPAYSWDYGYEGNKSGGGWGYAYQDCRDSGTCSCYCGYRSSCWDSSKKESYPCNWQCETCRTYSERTHYNGPGHAGSGVGYRLALDVYNDLRTAYVKIPYNFKTWAESEIVSGGDGGDVVYAGEEAVSEFSLELLARTNLAVTGGEEDPYLTITPKDSQAKIFSFTIGPDVATPDANILSGGTGGVVNIPYYTDPCVFFSARFGTVCGALTDTENRKTTFYGPFNVNGQLKGVFDVLNGVTVKEGGDEEAPETSTRVQRKEIVPDVEAGSKYCVAVGINHADSHDLPASDIPNNASSAANSASMSTAGTRWRISNISCRTIAKKPNFQAWGGIYTQGGIKTSTSQKYVGKKAGTPAANDSRRIFGSWSDMLAIGNGEIKGLTSASGLGYIGNNGGASGNYNYCRFVRMSIANDKCGSNTTGGANILVSNYEVLDKITSRYTLSEAEKNAVKLPEGSDVWNEAGTTTPLNGGGLYTYVDGDANITANTLTKLSGTRIIEVDGDMYIKQNICSGAGSCPTNTNSLILNKRNSGDYYNIKDLPQVIIIANNIYIGSEVSQIDAWLFARGAKDGMDDDGGVIDTCDPYDTAGLSTDLCNKTLIFNGPVFAKNLQLNRTAGAYPGANAVGAASADKDLASDIATGGRGLDASKYAAPAGYGSVTPAEIFNLRPDVYMWAYNQANHLSQATVVYMRELAPRY